MVDGRLVSLDILDTAGQEEYSALHENWYKVPDVLVIVCCVNESHTFEQAQIHYEKFKRARPNEQCPVVLVVNKCDLIDEIDLIPKAKEWANDEGIPCIKTCAKSKEKVDEVFFTAIREIWKKKKLKSKRLVKKMKIKLPQTQCNWSWCDCSCPSLSKWYDVLRYESEKQDQNMEKDKIQFFKANEPPSSDHIPSPIYSLKNFRVKRIFNSRRFIMAIICGLFLPIIIILQTVAFLMYSEFREAEYYPKYYAYEDIHSSIFYDFLGIVIGRKPGQDPETVKDRKWFLRQTMSQKLKRVFVTIIISFISFICFYNVSQVNNERMRVSMMETVGPLLLFWIVWLLLSFWIAYEIELDPPLPSALRLRYALSIQ